MNNEESAPMPDELLSQLAEFTDGGFLLFYLTDGGDVAICMNADSVSDLSRLTNYAQNWAEANKQAQIECMKEQILGQELFEEEESEFPADDDEDE